MTKRHTTDDEREQFQRAFAEARPLRPANAKASEKRRAVTHAETLDGRTRERLRRGELDPEARLDLHGHTADAAHRALYAFLKGARTRGAKMVLVVTGRGPRADPSSQAFELGYAGGGRGVLKNSVPRWLREPGFAEFVAGTQEAHRRHGGEGALYVYLRKRSR